MTGAPEPIFLDAGEAALVVEFGRSIEPAIHNRVLSLIKRAKDGQIT